MSNYAENICESIEIISKSLLEGLSYDKTVVCTVIDDSKRSKGIYTVKEGMGATYEAYSENTQYRKNNQVYVIIPGNNYNNQKMITGKKVTENNEPVIYSTPFDTIIDILDLRIPQAENVIGLLANCPNMPPEYPSFKRLFSMESYDKPYYGFSRLALRADFRSWLRETGCIEGNYGLKITVDFATETTNEAQTTYPVIRKELYLNVDDMIGNPYQFDTFFSQEKAFDISSYGGISAIFIDFYQEPDSFKINKKDENDEYKLLPYKDDFDGYLFNNLFVQNIQIAVGYDLGAYDNDFVQLYSFDQPNFSSKENEKSIKLKWIHLDGEKQIVMGPENTDYEYEIRWYRYIMGEQASDAYVTGGWVNINNPLNSSNFVFEAGQNQGKAYQTRLIPDAAKQAQEQIKAIVLFGEAPTYERYKFSDDLEEAKVEFNKNKARFFILENQDYISCADKDYDSTINSDETKGYYILGADVRSIYRTNPIIFSNDKDIVVNGVIDALSALSLTCFDYNKGKLIETYGNYLIYNQGNQLIDFAESQIIRGVRCNFDLIDTEIDDTYSLLTNTKISWIYPVKNTMITPYNLPSAAPAITVENLTFDLKPIEGSSNEVTDIYYKKITYTEDYDWTDKVSIYKAPYFLYKIMSSFSPRKTNNFIQCIIEKDGVTYHTVQELTFGQAGSAGTEYTFILEALDDLNVLTAGEENSLVVKALLYDSSGKQLDISNKRISWTFVNPQDTSQGTSQINGLSYSQEGLASTECKIIGTPSMDDLCIIKAVLNGWEEYKLTAFLSIPIRSDKKYLALSGATSVIYLTDGNPQYYESPYEIYADEEISGVIWSDYYSDNANSYQKIDETITETIYNNNKSKYYFKTDNNLYINCENEPWKREYYKRIDESVVTNFPELTYEDYKEDPTKYYFKGADGELYQCHKNDPWERSFYIMVTSLGELKPVDNLTEEEYNKNPDLYYYEDRDEIARLCDINDPFQKTFYVLKEQEIVYNQVTDLTQEEYNQNPDLYYFKGYDGNFVPCKTNNLFLENGAQFFYEVVYKDGTHDWRQANPRNQKIYEGWYKNGYSSIFGTKDLCVKNASGDYLKCNEHNIPYQMVYYIKEEGKAYEEVDLTQEEYEQQWNQNFNIRYYYKQKNGRYVNCYDANEPYVRKYLIVKQNRTEELISNITQKDFNENKNNYYYRRTDGTYISCANEPWIREYYQMELNYEYVLIEPQPSENDYNLNKDNYYYYQNNDLNKNPISCSNIPYTKTFYLQNKNLFLPEVKKRIDKEDFYYLHPTNLFIQGLPIYGVRGNLGNNIIWTQPILIIQNVYPVAMINQWDGKELKIEGGTILSNRIGVGRKNEQNTFSGVLLGDWEEHSQEGTDLQRYTGIFGFANGIRTYSFLDDGTALIGKNTGGQLKFDGNESTITSASYNDVDGPGIKIDFDDATIAMRGGSNNNHLFTIDASNDTSNDSQALYIGPSSNIDNSYFQVNWDGSATMSGAVITGDTRIQGIFDLNCQVQYGGSQKTLSEVLQAIDNAAAAAQRAADNAQNAIDLSGITIDAINNFIGTSKGGTIINGQFVETNIATFSYNTDKIPGVKVSTEAVALVGSGTWQSPANSLYINSSGSHFTGPLYINSNVYMSGKPADSLGTLGRLIFVKEG